MIKYRFPNFRQSMVGSWCPSLGYSGTILVDRSGRGRHGTLTNMDPPTDWVAVPGGGKSGVALDFDATDDYVSIADADYLSVAAKDFAISAWVRFPSTVPSLAACISKRVSSAANSEYNLLYRSSGDLAGAGFSLRVGNVPAVNPIAGYLITATSGRWYHVVGVVENGVAYVYVDGVLGTVSGTVVTPPSNQAANVTLNSLNHTGSSYALMQIDSVNIFSSALTGSDVAILSRYRGIEHETYRVPIVGLVSSSGYTATASITEADDTLAATATIAIAAISAITEASDTLSSTAAISIAATGGITEAGDTLSSTAAIAITATLSVTEESDTCVGAGSGGVIGTSTVTEADDTLSATATISIRASAGISESSDTLSATSTLLIRAVLSVTEASDSLSSTATISDVGLPTQVDGSPYAPWYFQNTEAW